MPFTCRAYGPLPWKMKIPVRPPDFDDLLERGERGQEPLTSPYSDKIWFVLPAQPGPIKKVTGEVQALFLV